MRHINNHEIDYTDKRADLIFDVGMHKGEDTEFYLKKGFRVVAFEANPELVDFCRNKFKKLIDSGTLTIVEGAIVNINSVEPGQETVAFFKNNDNSVWGTVCSEWKDRNDRLGSSSSMIKVGVVDFATNIKKYGMPYFMKIDIEGVDIVCLETLKLFHERPDYVSIESDKISYTKIKREINLFSELGYNSFQAIEQSSIPELQSLPNPAKEGICADHRFKDGSSGLFGLELAGEWKSRTNIIIQYYFISLGYYLLGDEGVMKDWSFIGAERLRELMRLLINLFTKARVPGWYDTHARLL